MSNEIKQCSACKIYENGTCWKKVIKHEDCHVKPTDNCKEYEFNPKGYANKEDNIKPVVPIVPDKPEIITPSKQVISNNATTDKGDKKPNDTKNSSTTVTK
jgi:hypothetical protein